MRHRLLAMLCALGPLVVPPAAYPQTARTVRISNDPVFLQVLANGVPMRLKIFNGEMARISSAGTTLGVTPRIVAGGVELHVYQILSVGGGERMREVDQATLVLGAVVPSGTTPLHLDLAVLDALALPPLPAEWSREATRVCAAPASQGETTTAAPLGPCSQCCVKCDEMTACACEVWMACGHCCCSSGLCGPCLGLEAR